MAAKVINYGVNADRNIETIVTVLSALKIATNEIAGPAIVAYLASNHTAITWAIAAAYLPKKEGSNWNTLQNTSNPLNTRAALVQLIPEFQAIALNPSDEILLRVAEPINSLAPNKQGPGTILIGQNISDLITALQFGKYCVNTSAIKHVPLKLTDLGIRIRYEVHQVTESGAEQPFFPRYTREQRESAILDVIQRLSTGDGIPLKYYDKIDCNIMIQRLENALTPNVAVIIPEIVDSYMLDELCAQLLTDYIADITSAMTGSVTFGDQQGNTIWLHQPPERLPLRQAMLKLNGLDLIVEFDRTAPPIYVQGTDTWHPAPNQYVLLNLANAYQQLFIGEDAKFEIGFGDITVKPSSFILVGEPIINGPDRPPVTLPRYHLKLTVTIEN
ncbi:MAG: hypothetical protein ABIG95_05435 [Candidatus Woesearchaeota archaeon]